MGRKLGLLVLGVFLLCPVLSHAAGVVAKVKGNAVLVNLGGDLADVGDMFYLLNADGKKRAIIKITKIKGDQAIAKVTAGHAEQGQTIARRGSSGGGGSTRSASRSNSKWLPQKAYWGFLGGVNYNMMQVDLPSPASTTVSLNGISFSAMGIFDYQLFQKIWFRGGFGYQGFAASGPADCPGSSTCNATINYLDFMFLGRYIFTDDQIRPWLGLGASLLFPATKSSTALDSSSISTSSVFNFVAGVDWSISKEMYIPISLEYGYFPKSQDVGVQWIAIRAGVVWPF